MASAIDKKALKEMIGQFYKVAHLKPPQILIINDNVANVFMKMLREAKKCTTAFNLIPHPPAGPATIKWLIKNIGRTIFEQSTKKLSVVCARGIIRNWGHELQRAGSGV